MDKDLMCPCQSKKWYRDCCKPFHQGQLPQEAIDLMRSRFSAYVLGNTRYIIDTTHPQNPHFQKDKKKWEKELLEYCVTTLFLDLEIIDSGQDRVHFIAYLKQGKEEIVHEEKSHFSKLNGKWLYHHHD